MTFLHRRRRSVAASRKFESFRESFAAERKVVADGKAAVLEDSVDVGDLLDGQRGSVRLEIGSTQPGVVLAVVIRQSYLEYWKRIFVKNKFPELLINFSKLYIVIDWT